MATATKLKSDIKKLKAAIASKASKPILGKLKTQLAKAENELANLSKGVKTKTSSTTGTQKTLTALQKLLKKKEYSDYKGSGTDLKKDAQEGAFSKGRRVSKGLKGNQYGSAAENKGNVYYEYRPNRYDVQAQKYPKLADGGMMEDGGELGVNKNRIYFSSFAEVMDAIYDIADYNGYKIVDIFPDLSYGGVGYGETKKAKVELEWNGKEKRGKSKKRETNTMNVQIYRMDSGSYELNTYFSYENGGMMEDGVDLFEDYENIPEIVQEVLDYHSEAFEFGDYRKLEDALVDLENIGYTFEFDLNGMPYDLREIGQVGKSEVDEEEFARGGRTRSKKVTYVPNEAIQSISTTSGVTFKSNKILDGAYVKGQDVKYAMGGITEHGLEVGDKIVDFGENGKMLYVNNNNKMFQVDINKGIREQLNEYGGMMELFPNDQMMAMGGEMHKSEEGYMARGGKIDLRRDDQRFAKPKGWRWKEYAVTDGIVSRAQLAKSPTEDQREEYPEYVYYETRAERSDVKPSYKYKSL